VDSKGGGGFDFEYWRRLAAEDPAAFESARASAVTALIEAAPPERQARLQGIQWRIDRLRERAPNPMAACLRLSRMMWDSLLGPNGLFATLKRLERIDGRSAQPPAKVLPLRRRHSTGRRGRS